MLRFVEGFDHYNTSALGARKWTNVDLTNTLTWISGRFGGSAVRCNRSSTYNKILDNQSTWILGVAIRYDGFSFNNTYMPYRFLDGATEQLSIRPQSTGQLQVSRNGTTLSTSTLALSINTWYYLEFKATFHATSGSYSVRINGVTWTSGSGINTSASGNAYANTLSLYSGTNTGSSNSDMDDLYLCDGTSTRNNDFLGEIRVETLYPSAPGTFTQYSKTGGATNWQSVNNNPPDDDTSYVSSNTPGQEDTYALTDLSSTPTFIPGFQTILMARKDNAGPRALTSVIRSIGTDYLGASNNLSASYLCNSDIFEYNPATLSAWSGSQINALEAGSRLTT